MLATTDHRSVLLITLDSCRYDSFQAANAINMKTVGPLHRAMAPGNFTYASHAAMFVGFTPGVASLNVPYVNPKQGKIFKLMSGGWPGHSPPFIELDGKNIIDGFNKLGFLTVGSGAVGWFDPSTPAGTNLTGDFQQFLYPGNTYSIDAQVEWLMRHIEEANQPVFAFLNVGETHVPYYYKDAPWDLYRNPCVPFSDNNDAAECKVRQIACIEYVDNAVKPLLEAFREHTTIVSADHGDCWGEDGLWEHGIHHDKVLEVPLLFRLSTANVSP